MQVRGPDIRLTSAAAPAQGCHPGKECRNFCTPDWPGQCAGRCVPARTGGRFLTEPSGATRLRIVRRLVRLESSLELGSALPRGGGCLQLLVANVRGIRGSKFVGSSSSSPCSRTA